MNATREGFYWVMTPNSTLPEVAHYSPASVYTEDYATGLRTGMLGKPRPAEWRIVDDIATYADTEVRVLSPMLTPPSGFAR